jgi:hypothetical protein
MATLEESRSQVNIEDVEHETIVYFNVGPQAAARLASADAEVVIENFADGKARQQRIAVDSAAKRASLAEKEFHSEFFGYEARLMMLARAARYAYDFLKGDDVGVHFAEDFDYAGGADSSIKPFAAMDVVGRYFDPVHGD